MHLYCTVCHRKYYAERSSSRYCSQSCKERARTLRGTHKPPSDLMARLRAMRSELQDLQGFYYQAENVDIEALVDSENLLHQIRDIVTEIDMSIGRHASTMMNRVYRCANCGQMTHGRVDECVFCHGQEFEIFR